MHSCDQHELVALHRDLHAAENVLVHQHLHWEREEDELRYVLAFCFMETMANGQSTTSEIVQKKNDENWQMKVHLKKTSLDWVFIGKPFQCMCVATKRICQSIFVIFYEKCLERTPMYVKSKSLYVALRCLCLCFVITFGVGWIQRAETKVGTQHTIPSTKRFEGKKILFLLGHLRCGGGERAFIDMLHLLPLPSSSYDVCVLQRGGSFEKFLPQGTNIISLQKARQNSYTTIVVYADWLHPKLWGDIPAKRRIMFVHVDLSYFPGHVLRRQKCCTIFDHFVGVSECATRSFLSYQPWHAQKVKTIRNCVNVSLIRQRSLSPQDDIVPSQDRINFVSVARLTYEKGIDRAIRVHKRLDNEGFDFRWYIIGDGNKRRELESQVVKNGLQGKFVFLGMKDNPYPYMKAADILVMPSYAESGPLVTTEALCLGCPPVATDVGSVSQQINSGVNGLIVNNSDLALYDGLKMLLKKPEVRRSYREAATKFTFDNESIVRKLLDLFLPGNEQEKEATSDVKK